MGPAESTQTRSGNINSDSHSNSNSSRPQLPADDGRFEGPNFRGDVDGLLDEIRESVRSEQRAREELLEPSAEENDHSPGGNPFAESYLSCLHSDEVSLVALNGNYPTIDIVRVDTQCRISSVETPCPGLSLKHCVFRDESAIAFAEMRTSKSMISFYGCESLDRIGELPMHRTSIRCLASFSQGDGIVPLMASGDDKFVYVWDLQQEIALHRFTGHSSIVMCLLPLSSANRNWLASGSSDSSLRLWDLERDLPVPGGVLYPHTSRNGSGVIRPHPVQRAVFGGVQYPFVISCSSEVDMNIALTDLNSFERVRALHSYQENFAICQHPEKPHLLFVGGIGGRMSLFDIRHFDGALPVHRTGIHGNSVVTEIIPVVGRRGVTFVSCSENGLVRFWNEKMRRRKIEGLSEAPPDLKTAGSNHGMCLLKTSPNDEATGWKFFAYEAIAFSLGLVETGAARNWRVFLDGSNATLLLCPACFDEGVGNDE